MRKLSKLQRHLYFLGFRFVPEGIQRGDHVGIPVCTSFVRQREKVIRCDAHYILRPVDIYFLPLPETVHHEPLCSFRVGGVPIVIPREEMHILGEHLIEVLYLVWATVMHMGIRGNQGRCPVEVVLHRVGYPLEVVQYLVAVPVAVSVHERHLARLTDLYLQLILVDASLEVLPDVEGLLEVVLVPPVQQGGIIGRGMPSLPVELRQVVIDPPLLYPKLDVGIEVVVVLQPVGIASVGVATLVPVNAEGANPETYPRLGGGDGQFQVAVSGGSRCRAANRPAGRR
jgi:hypothetical protein